MTCYIFSKETAMQDTKKISFVAEKKAEKESDQKAGETNKGHFAQKTFRTSLLAQVSERLHNS